MGKNTQSTALRDYINYSNKGLARVISFPRDDGPAGKTIRSLLNGRYAVMQAGREPDDLLVESQIIQALMLADRLAAVELLRDPDKITICDRYIYSGIVYGSVDGLNEPWLYDMHKLLPQADIQILLDANPEIAKTRRPEMRDRYEMDFAKLHKIREKYLSIWRTNANHEVGKWFVVDASRDPSVVHKDIINCYNTAELIKENGKL